MRTPVYGDVNGFPDRINVGSRSAMGGIQSGDAYPGTPWRRNGEPSRGRLPLLLWCGTLTEGTNRVIVVPTIWEHDGETKQLSRFVDEMNRVVLSAPFLLASAGAYSTMYYLTGGGYALTFVTNVAVLSFYALNVAALIEKSNVFGNAEDRPIGLQVEDGSYQPKSIVLGYEAATAHPAASVEGKPRGIIPMRYTDIGEVGDYEVYLEIEPVRGTCAR